MESRMNAQCGSVHTDTQTLGITMQSNMQSIIPSSQYSRHVARVRYVYVGRQ